MTFQKKKHDGWMVVIEWDGDKPPTSFYNRVRKLTSGVRQTDKVGSPFSRRAEVDVRAVHMQEGAILCMSKSLARALALLAQEYGAINVDVAEVVNLSPVVATEEDLQALQRIRNTLGRRGRPPRKYRRWKTITCFEEIVSRHRETDEDIINCEECGSLDIAVTYPNVIAGADNIERTFFRELDFEDETLFDTWLRLRAQQHGGITFPQILFDEDDEDSVGYFEPMPYYMHDTHVEHQSIPHSFPQPQKDLLNMMYHSCLTFLDYFADQPDKIIEILDGIFVSRYKYPAEERLEGRLQALSLAMLLYPEISKDYLLAIQDDKVDFFDAAPAIDPRRLVDLFAIYMSAKLAKEKEYEQ